MEDKEIVCIQCDRYFIFSVKEQERYLSKGFDEPKRCPDCRRNKHESNGVPTEKSQNKKKTKNRNGAPKFRKNNDWN